MKERKKGRRETKTESAKRQQRGEQLKSKGTLKTEIRVRENKSRRRKRHNEAKKQKEGMAG